MRRQAVGGEEILLRRQQLGDTPHHPPVGSDGHLLQQTAHPHTNPHDHAPTSAFAQLTGVPMVLNTSFNENEPVVCALADIDCGFRTLESL